MKQDRVYMTVNGLSTGHWATWVSLYNQYGHMQRYDLTSEHEQVIRENGDGEYTVTYDPTLSVRSIPLIESIAPEVMVPDHRASAVG